MLGKRAGPLLERQKPAQGRSRTAHSSSSSYVTDRDHVRCLRLGDHAPTALSLPGSRVIDDSLLICQSEVCATDISTWPQAGADCEKSTERVFETQASTSSSPCRIGNRTYGVMSFIGQAQNISAEGDRVDYHPMLSEEDVQLQKEEGEDQVQQARRGNAANSSSELNAAYFSGDSDLTAEAMGEESSHSSSQENGCTLKLEAAATQSELLSKASKSVDQQQQMGDASILLTGRSCSVEGQNSSWGISKSGADGRYIGAGTKATTEACGFPRAKEAMQVRGVKEVTSPTEDAVREEVVESWLELRLGQTKSESYELEKERKEEANRSAAMGEHSDAIQGTMVTLQLLPEKCDAAEMESKGEEVAIQLNPWGRQGYMNDQSSAWVPAGAAPFTSLMAKMDMNVQENKRMYQQADQYSAWNRLTNPSPERFYINASWDHQPSDLTYTSRLPYIGYGNQAPDWSSHMAPPPAAAARRPPIIPTAVRDERLLHPWLAAASAVARSTGSRPKMAPMDAFPPLDQGLHPGGHVRLPSGGDAHMRSFLLPRQLQQQPAGRLPPQGGGAHQFPAAGVTAAKRLANPPPSRGHPGVWFSLQASPSHDNDPDAPPMQKVYMRIRDGQTPISVLKKYLVCKLGLSSETEVDIMCRGNLLVSNLTVQHVRDKIWCSEEVEHGDTLGFRSTRTHSSHPKECIMALHYQRNSCGLTLNLLKG